MKITALIILSLVYSVIGYHCQENKSNSRFTIDYDDTLNIYMFCDETKQTASGATITAIFGVRTEGLQIDRRITQDIREDYAKLIMCLFNRHGSDAYLYDHVEVSGEGCF